MLKSGLSGWTLAIARTLDASGVPYEPVFRKVGMDPSFLSEGRARYYQYAISRLWQTAVKATGDPYFGLKLAEHIRPSTFHVVGYAMSCSTTLGAALQRFARYAKLISNSANVTLETENDQWRLHCEFDTGAELLPQTLDAVLVGVVYFSRWITCKDIAPIKVQFRHSLCGNVEEYEKVMKCPVLFEQTENSLTFRATDADQAVLSANEQLACLLDDMAVRQMAELSGRFSTKVRECLLEQFSFGQFSKQKTAELMHMTERTLLRRLGDEGTTFRDVLDKLREELAYKYLRQSDATVEQVSARLGFSDGSTFSRAFKRWTGRRPSCVRQDLIEQEKLEMSIASRQNDMKSNDALVVGT